MAFNPLEGFSNPWAAGGNSAALNTLATSDKPGYEALQTNVFDNDKEVLGLYGLSDKNFDPKRIILPLKLLSYNSIINPYHGGDDYFYSTNENYYPSGTEGNRLKEIVEEQKLKWKKILQKEGQLIQDVELKNEFLLNELAKGLIGPGLFDDIMDLLFAKSEGFLSNTNSFTNAALEVLSRFYIENKQEDSPVPEIIKEQILNHPLTIRLKDELFGFIQEKLNDFKGDFSKINPSMFIKSERIYKTIYYRGKNYRDIKNLPYYKFDEKTKLSLNAIVGGIQGIDLILNSLEVKNSIEFPVTNPVFPFNTRMETRQDKDTLFYNTTFSLILYDDFGINANDITDAKGLVKKFGLPALIAFWILHSQRGFKPFTHTITCNFNHIFRVKK